MCGRWAAAPMVAGGLGMQRLRPGWSFLYPKEGKMSTLGEGYRRLRAIGELQWRGWLFPVAGRRAGAVRRRGTRSNGQQGQLGWRRGLQGDAWSRLDGEPRRHGESGGENGGGGQKQRRRWRPFSSQRRKKGGKVDFVIFQTSRG